MSPYKQEMPPPGGFSPINVLGKAPKRPINGFLTIAGLYACTFVGLSYQSWLKNKLAERDREEEEVRIALSPFVFAEQERMYLKQIRRNRDYEKELMADVPGWKVGHWHDVPVYHNPRGLWCDPSVDEFYAHTNDRFRNSRVGVTLDYF
ncbi:NADH dehydrogenase [ubiquinone] 1 alpha subcomplex subunit [Paragonimus heterotremus]|uniref:NADH dehydrogenase [ubiquinone] 1 alpha subcomplex subunit 13 n=1 Tax=Paragonimus heterotremus TaxID=100268 RepID=A0A8J4X001_9TREM|nr:NADH dehydrogenase [ubiquinone] 1 alpha subcomplex subunit [Paragonimus heterotremus]